VKSDDMKRVEEKEGGGQRRGGGGGGGGGGDGRGMRESLGSQWGRRDGGRNRGREWFTVAAEAAACSSCSRPSEVKSDAGVSRRGGRGSEYPRLASSSNRLACAGMVGRVMRCLGAGSIEGRHGALGVRAGACIRVTSSGGLVEQLDAFVIRWARGNGREYARSCISLLPSSSSLRCESTIIQREETGREKSLRCVASTREVGREGADRKQGQGWTPWYAC